MIITKRIPALDDRRLLLLIKNELIPLASRQPRLFRLKELRQRIRKGRTLVARDRKGLCMGFLHLIYRNGQYWIDMLAVNRRMQGRGIGRELLLLAERIARARRGTSIKLMVDLKNTKGIRFYENNGYAVKEYVQDVECYLMEKAL